ncbi:MAG TPA: hypothetical protein DEW09_18290 [Pseudomonas sp.]|jgi:hypothetical protein|nr:hypothetical protein [Pseudomonas sp.]
MSFEDGDLFSPFLDCVPHNFVFRRARELQARARRLVKGRTTEQLEDASRDAAFLTAEYFQIEKDRWIVEQLERGASILRFLTYEERTEGGLRHLIDEHGHHPDVAAELYFPREENTSELEALEAALDDVELDSEGFPNGTIAEYLAILALNQISLLMNLSGEDDSDAPTIIRDDLHEIRLRGMADQLADIMETVCRAESLHEQGELKKRLSEQFRRQMELALPEKADELAKKKVSLAARKAALSLHEATRAKKAEAVAEWKASGSKYSSMAAFARLRHRAYGVTDRTLGEWIREYRKSNS